MIWRSFLSAQSRQPSGFFGRFLMGRYLDYVNSRTNQLVFDKLAPGPQEHVLEIGFGGAELLLRIATDLETGRIDGLDLSPEMVARAVRRTRKLGLSQKTGFHQGSVEKLPFDDASFDCACSVHTIYFWPQLGRGLDELARVIKPGGRLLLGFSSQQMLRDEGWVERGFSAYSKQQVSDACQSHGFEQAQLSVIEREPRGKVYACLGIRS